MRKQVFILVLCISVCSFSWGEERHIVSNLSPGLRKFITSHPSAAKVFDGTLANSFSNRTVDVYYFYSDSGKAAFHYYPNTGGMAEVIICVQENQSTLD